MDETLHEIEKGSALIRFSIRQYAGIEYVDIRQFFEDDEGSWKPTKKGVTISLERLDDFAEGVRKLQEAADERHQSDDRGA